MNSKIYDDIFVSIAIVPILVIPFTGCIVYYYHRSPALLLVVMKNIVSRKTIDKKITYLVCNRKISTKAQHIFVFISFVVIATCVMCFLSIAIVDVTYECTHEPGLDCFKKQNGLKFNDDRSPVNCSTISRDDLVSCYRLTIFDLERTFIGAAAAYVLFKMLNVVLLIVAHLMLWAAQKWEKKTLLWFKLGFTIIVSILIYIPIILSSYLDEVESAFRKISYAVFIQFTYLVLLVMLFVGGLPWVLFGKNEVYYGDASLPEVGEHDNEMN